MSEPIEKPKEELPRMSFGDHLDELRRRLLWCAGTLAVSVLVMLPFKKEVTSIYIQPYHNMWDKGYKEWVDELETKYAASPGPADPGARYAAAEFLTPDLIDQVLDGKYRDSAELREKSGFEKPIPAKGSAERDAFEDEFIAYSDALVLNQHIAGYVQYNRRWSKFIQSGRFKAWNKVHDDGGFLLHRNLQAAGGLEDMWTFMAAAILFSAIIASPVLLWHIWAFIAAGLYKNERAVVHRALPLAVGLLIAGVSFGFFLMVPYGLYFLTQLMDWEQVGPLFTVALYFKFFLTLTVALGLVFQLPVLMVALQKVGLVRLGTIAKNWRWVILGMFVISAMLTPPDPVTQIMMVTPMISLFLFGLLLMWRVEKRQKAAQAV